jgi:glucosyl-3-phosphoglycerate synthase
MKRLWHSRLESSRKAVFGLAMHRFHHHQFADTAALLAAKGGRTISICIPTLNEAATIGSILGTIRTRLMEETPLVDEVLVIDSGSQDETTRIAASEGAKVFLSAEIAADSGSHLGKGENLWKALQASRGDVVCFLDGDISNFHPGFVAGLVGPLLSDETIDYVKAYYERPLAHGDAVHSSGGGRVSEILVRPLISMFYPELNFILQPLSGEYAARRSLLETLPFPVGYGVEIAHLIDLAKAGKLDRIAQTDLVRRIHRNRDDGDLGDTAFAILKVILRRLERDGKLSLTSPLPELHQRWIIDAATIQQISRHIPEPERPPLQAWLQKSAIPS